MQQESEQQQQRQRRRRRQKRKKIETNSFSIFFFSLICAAAPIYSVLGLNEAFESFYDIFFFFKLMKVMFD